jgi:hypothetical protein
VLLVAGCAKSGGVDTAKLEGSFSASAAELKAEMDKVVAAVKSEDYAGAQATLQKLAANAQVTDAQKQAIQDVVAQIQKKLAEKVAKMAEDAKATGDNLKNSLPKP